MASEDQTLINGRYAARNHVVLKVDGRRYKEVTTIKWGSKRERSPVRILDEDNSVVAFTDGQTTPEELVIGLRKASAMLCKKYLAQKGGGSTGGAPVPITVTIAVPGQDVIQVAMPKAYFNGNPSEVPDNTDPLTDELAFSVTKVSENGLSVNAKVSS
jgi:hypothetical protein